MTHDLLSDDLVRVSLDGGTRSATLAQILAWLSGEHEVAFPGLQPHQRHPWFAFLVQLGAIARARGGLDLLSCEPAAWRAALLRLTGGRSEPWSLIVPDLSMPALLQPPVPEASLDGFKTAISTPDQLDILLTTRNFDVKGQRMNSPLPEHWLYALVTKQTFEGYSGKANYGIVRMNGGQSNRPCVSVAPSLSWGTRFQRDVQVWLDHRAEIIERHAYDPNGHTLVWLAPWDGTSSISRRALDPFFIESCRRTRLAHDGGGIKAAMGTSSVARIDTADHAGDTGDIWTPVQTTSKKSGRVSLTVPASGFTYKKLSDLLFGDGWERPPALEVRADDQPAPVVIAQALVRGQGKTEGYHERVVPVPAKARKMLAAGDGRRRLGELAKLRINRTAEARDRVLKLGVLTLLQGVREEKVDFRDARASPWLERFEQRVDDSFFTSLFDAVDLPADEVRRVWDGLLVDLLEQTFKDAVAEAPMPSAHRYKILAAAEGRFRGALSNIFGELLAGRRSRRIGVEQELVEGA